MLNESKTSRSRSRPNFEVKARTTYEAEAEVSHTGVKFNPIADPAPPSWDPEPLFGALAPKLGDPLHKN